MYSTFFLKDWNGNICSIPASESFMYLLVLVSSIVLLASCVMWNLFGLLGVSLCLVTGIKLLFFFGAGPIE